MSYEFIPIDRNNIAIGEIAALLRSVFPNAKKYTEAYIKWQYLDNPDGKIVGCNAYQNGNLVAHYAVMPIVADVFGAREKGLLSLNTATLPEHQGNKLFTTLADISYRAAAEEGYCFVAGVANANSTHGFVNKLGFQLVRQLDAKLGIGKIRPGKKLQDLDFIKRWDGVLDWRLKNPEQNYKIKDGLVFASAEKPGIEAVLIDLENILPLKDNGVSLGFRPIELWIGVDDSIDWKNSFYIDVPKSLRPSPLNFIFKDLTGRNRKLNKNRIRINALDFDAY